MEQYHAGGIVATLFADKTGAVATPISWDGMPEFADWLGSQRHAPKDTAPLLKLATFGDRRTERGSLRSNGNVLQIYGVELDHDAGTMTPREAHERLSGAGLAAVVQATHSHSSDAPRWRAWLPLYSPAGPILRERLARRADALLSGASANESFVLSQAFFIGSGHDPLVSEGAFIDQADWLDGLSPAPPETAHRSQRTFHDLPDSMQLADLESALGALDSNDRATWISAGLALRTAGDEGFRLWDNWSQLSPKYSPADAAETWETFDPTDTDWRAVFAAAKRNGWLNPRPGYRSPDAVFSAPSAQVPIPAPTAPIAIDAATGAHAVGYSEDWIAEVFADRLGSGLKWVQPWGSWYHYADGKWKREETLIAFDECRRTCRMISSLSGLTDTQARSLAKATTVAAVERLAKADRRMAAQPKLFDRDPWLLTTPDAAIDLRTGIARPNAPEDFSTRSAACAVAADAHCPIWIGFLNTTFAGDSELVDYMQRLIGYCLTGTIDEHVIPFAYGTGGNGKGVLINTITRLFGDYATVSPPEVFQETRNDRHPTEIARLRGARLVASQETEEGKPWAEARLKQMTGGDPITARFMHGDFFTFEPEFKLFIAGNHKPALRTVDAAIKRRLHLIPFNVTVPAEMRDPELANRLKAEWPSILRWAIDGCLAWQRHGLNPPRAVLAATDTYFEDEDSFGLWISEQCDLDPTAETLSSMLHQSYGAWAVSSGLPAISAKRLSQVLEGRGFVKVRGRNGSVFRGLALRVGGPFGQ